MATLWNRAGHYTFTLWLLLLLSFCLFSSPILSRRTLDVYHTSDFRTPCGLSANLGCRSETCCRRLAKNTGCKKPPKNSSSGHHRTTLSGYIFGTGTYRQSEKNTCHLSNSNISARCSHNMANFGPLANVGGALCSTPQSFADTHYYRLPYSNATKTRKPLKLEGVPQTRQRISAVSSPKFTILCGHVEEIDINL